MAESGSHSVRFLRWDIGVRTLENRSLLVLVIAVSLAFAWILLPFYGAALWATVLAIVFAPLYRWLSTGMRRPNLAAFTTLLIILVMVILPLTLIAASLVQEASGLYESARSGELNFSQFFRRVLDTLPGWALNLLGRLGLTNLDAIQERLSAGLLQGSQFLASLVIDVGQSTVGFVVSLFVTLYLLFFLLRDGDGLSRRIKEAIPLRAEQQRAFSTKFTVAIRAIIKGDILVALLQGALGGLIFWLLGIRAPLLWAALMAVLALLPVVGTGLVWGPVAIYFLVTGAVWQGILLLGYGVLVISVVDNFLRPFLVGKDTKIPDYIVLITTLGGIATFGANGIVIGPVIAAMFLAAWDIFTAARREIRNDSTRR
jgi:predicted PurR-regulated permease PerM